MKHSSKAILKAVAWTLLFLMPLGQAYAIDIDPGENRTECPGTKITLGGSPTAGPEPIGNYTFYWYSLFTGWSSTEANPEITVPDVITTYIVRVSDADGFTCQKSVTITPVILKELQFNPNNIPADGKSTAQGSVITDARGRSFVWSIVDPVTTDATINENTGLVRAGTEPVTVKVKVQDKQAIADKLETCYAENTLCIGDPDKCCPDISGEMMFGPVSVRLTQPIKSSGADKDGYCSYSTTGIYAVIQAQGFMRTPINYELTGVTISWKQKGIGEDRTYKEVRLSWSGKAPTRNFGKIMANLTKMEVAVNSEGQISGSTTFTILQTADIALGGNVFLAKSTKGTFTYLYKSKNSFEGDFDFGGAEIVLQHKKNTKVLAEAVGTLTPGGNFDGELTLKSQEPFSIGGYKVSLKKMFWKFFWNIDQNEVDLKKGQVTLNVTEIKNTKGSISADITLDGKTATGTATFDKLEAFGCNIEGKLNVTTDYLFNSLNLQGQNITAKHAEFDNAIAINEFTIADGKLTSFNFKANVKYKGIYFNISKAVYSEGKSSLSLSALVDLGSVGNFEVYDFVISGAGSISIGKIVVSLTKYPLSINGSLTFGTNSFKGTYTGTIEGGPNIGGTIELGSQGNFNYAYFELIMKSSKGFPVGPVVRIDELGGRFGFNYHYSLGIKQGSYLVGVRLGISDAGNIVGLLGDVTITIGTKAALEIEGQVRVPSKAPHYFNGKLKVNYFLGTNEMEGSTSAALKIPARSGKMLSLSTGNMGFKLNQSGWNVKATNMSGKIMDEITMSGSIDLRGNASQDDITGTVSGTLNYSKSVLFTYPKTFDHENCTTAELSVGKWGFGVYGDLAFKLNSAFNTQVNAEGFVGAVKTNLSGKSLLKAKWPCYTCVDCLKTLYVDFNGNVELKYEGETTYIRGNVTFNGGPDENETENIEIAF